MLNLKHFFQLLIDGLDIVLSTAKLFFLGF